MNLTNQLLIATPKLTHSQFARAVIYICQHDKNGAMGFVVNHILEDFPLGEIFDQLEISVVNPALKTQKILMGGPVQRNSGFVIHHPEQLWKSSVVVDNDIAITTSKDIIEAIARHDLKGPSLVALGYTGWGPGQLENEIMQNDWLTSPVSTNIIFNTPIDKRWEAANHLIGIKDIASFTHWSGRA